MGNIDKSIKATMDPEQKKKALKWLEYSDTKRLNDVLGKIPGSEQGGVPTMIEEVINETQEGFRIVGRLFYENEKESLDGSGDEYDNGEM